MRSCSLRQRAPPSDGRGLMRRDWFSFCVRQPALGRGDVTNGATSGNRPRPSGDDPDDPNEVEVAAGGVRATDER